MGSQRIWAQSSANLFCQSERPLPSTISEASSDDDRKMSTLHHGSWRSCPCHEHANLGTIEAVCVHHDSRLFGEFNFLIV
jgi:hypothetical protein